MQQIQKGVSHSVGVDALRKMWFLTSAADKWTVCMALKHNVDVRSREMNAVMIRVSYFPLSRPRVTAVLF